MKEYVSLLYTTSRRLAKDYGKLLLVIFLTALLTLVLCFSYSLTNKRDLEVFFFDVGQGDGIFVLTPSGKSMILDGGPSNKILEKVRHVLPYTDRDIDVMVATHPDADHVTGLIPVVKQYDVRMFVDSGNNGDTKIADTLYDDVATERSEVHHGEAGDLIDFHDGVIARILWPNKNFKNKKSDTNASSVTILLEYKGKTFLLTGDLPTGEENKILGELPNAVDVYKAGHHGSKYSSGEVLLSKIKPDYSVISAGKDNKYGHPNEETLERLTRYSKSVLSTIDLGDITFSVSREGSILEKNYSK